MGYISLHKAKKSTIRRNIYFSKILYFQWKTFISIVNVFVIGRHKLYSYFLFEKMLFGICKSPYTLWISLVAQTVKKSGNAGDSVWSLGGADPLENWMATHPNILAWRIPGTEKPGGPWGREVSDMTGWLTLTFTSCRTVFKKYTVSISIKTVFILYTIIQKSFW